MASDNYEPDDDEKPVGEDAVEHVQLVLDLARADHVADLEEDENVEHSRQVSRVRLILQWIVSCVTVKGRRSSIEHVLAVPVSIFGIGVRCQYCWIDCDLGPVIVIEGEFFNDRGSVIITVRIFPVLRDKFGSTKDESKEDADLEESLSQDMLSHSDGNDVLTLTVRCSVQQLRLRVLSGEGQSSQSVHDHIDPEELDSSQGSLSHNNTADEGDDKCCNVDSQLELKETANVVIDIAAPAASLDN